MNYTVLTLFPEVIEAYMQSSILGRATESGLIGLKVLNIRDYSCNKHNRVDDYPYGGGAGMVMEAGPVKKACDAARGLAPDKKSRLIYMSPIGKTFNEEIAKKLSLEENLIFLCGHYEGIDERVLETEVDDYISLGDFVLTGGELPALAVIDAVSRLIPGVLNNEGSAMDESFENGLLEYPQYTRPEEFMGKRVPEILLSGHHANIQRYRLGMSILRTLRHRPDMLGNLDFTKEMKKAVDLIGDLGEISKDEAELLDNIINSQNHDKKEPAKR